MDTYDELLFTELIANRILIYLNNMRKPRACTDLLLLEIYMLLLILAQLSTLSHVETELCFQWLSYVVNIKGFFSISHYETLWKL